MSREDGFLTRWSRRKVEAKREDGQEVVPVPAEAASLPVDTGEESPIDLSMLPSLDDLTPSSDITMFLQKGVPEVLKNAALQKIWATDPVIRDYIGPADFQWDFNAPGSITGYGELAAGTDVASMVSDIADHHLKKVVDEVKALVAGDAPVPVSARAEAVGAPEQEAVEAVPENPVLPVALPARRRHGGATPR